MAKPEKIAPATKYGGKIVVCQPGMTDVAKSKLTTVWTLSTSGVESRPESGRPLVVVPVPRRAAPAQGEDAVEQLPEPRGGAIAERRQVGNQAEVPEQAETVT